MMADSSICFGHTDRAARKEKISQAMANPPKSPVESKIVLLRKGPVSAKTSLRELEEHYARKPEWKVIEEGGMLSVPVEELRMMNPPKPDRKGNIKFAEKKGKGAANQIDNYSMAETVTNLKENIVLKYDAERERETAAGNTNADRSAQIMALKLPEFTAVQRWLDNQAEIKVKKALVELMTGLGIPTVIIRSVSLRTISALNDFGIELKGDGEIDLVLAFVS